VATAARPDAVHDFSLDPAKKQWNPERNVIGLNPHGRRQTKKYRAIVIAPRQVIPLLEQVKGNWIPGVSVRSAWRSMCRELGWPGDGEAGMKLIRRSIAQLLRDAGTPRGWNEEWQKVETRVVREDTEMQLGHRRIKSMTDIYAPFELDYLATVTRTLEAIIDAIIERVPGAFTLSDSKPLHGES
jgi:integrase